MTDDELEAALDDLYAGPASSFVASRTALVRRLRAEKRRDDAALVASLRRPTVVAAALNTAARAQPDAVEELLDVGRRLTEAQEAMLAGDDPDAVKQVVSRRRRLTSVLAAGVDAAHHDEAVATLEAASVDPALGERLRRGRLEREEVAASGFELLLRATVPNRPMRAVAEDDEPPPEPEPEPDGRDEERAARERLAELDAARKRLAEASRAVDAAREALEALE